MTVARAIVKEAEGEVVVANEYSLPVLIAAEHSLANALSEHYGRAVRSAWQQGLAIAEVGRIDKTIHTLNFIDDKTRRRSTLQQLNLS